MPATTVRTVSRELGPAGTSRLILSAMTPPSLPPRRPGPSPRAAVRSRSPAPGPQTCRPRARGSRAGPTLRVGREALDDAEIRLTGAAVALANVVGQRHGRTGE